MLPEYSVLIENQRPDVLERILSIVQAYCRAEHYRILSSAPVKNLRFVEERNAEGIDQVTRTHLIAVIQTSIGVVDQRGDVFRLEVTLTTQSNPPLRVAGTCRVAATTSPAGPRDAPFTESKQPWAMQRAVAELAGLISTGCVGNWPPLPRS
jgi:hypothetical protein